jgi:hypothetical protein
VGKETEIEDREVPGRPCVSRGESTLQDQQYYLLNYQDEEHLDSVDSGTSATQTKLSYKRETVIDSNLVAQRGVWDIVTAASMLSLLISSINLHNSLQTLLGKETPCHGSRLHI